MALPSGREYVLRPAGRVLEEGREEGETEGVFVEEGLLAVAKRSAAPAMRSKLEHMADRKGIRRRTILLWLLTMRLTLIRRTPNRSRRRRLCPRRPL